MGVNIGAFLGGAICGYLGQEISWHLGFGIAGVFMVLGLVVFVSYQRILEDKGFSPVPEQLAKKIGGIISTEWALYIGAFLIVPVAVFLVQYHTIMTVLLYPLGAVALVYVVYESFKFDVPTRQKLWAAAIMVVFSVLFWGFYEQSGGSLNLMAERNVDMTVLGHTLPSAMVNNAVNPFYIIFMTPLFAVMWSFLERRKIDPSTPMKFGLAFLFLGLGYYIFVMGGAAGVATGYMPLIYFMLAYLVITTGELFLSPIGLSMITKLSPLQMVGFMMGMWFLASAFGQHLAGEIGAHMSVPHDAAGAVLPAIQSLPIYMAGCKEIAFVSIGGGVLLILLSPVIRKLMNGVH
jgi:POT family proton-dependent oligopeptide transporter